MFLINTLFADFTCFRNVLDEFSSVICLLLCLYLSFNSTFIGTRFDKPREGGRRVGEGGGGVSAGRPAIAGRPANHLDNNHSLVHACLPHRPCSQHLKMMSPIYGVCGKTVWMVYFSG